MTNEEDILNKLLTVSVACYNVEAYLRQTLDSCVVPEIMDRLEVIVVNDGSEDGTAGVAMEYVRKWPGTFVLINKENGGYGSAFNASLKAASGRYFRLLDGDDWFDSDGLREFMAILEDAREDMIITRFRRVFESDGHTEERDEGENIPFVTGTFEELPDDAWFTMHAITYRTSLLRDNGVTIFDCNGTEVALSYASEPYAVCDPESLEPYPARTVRNRRGIERTVGDGRW